ncbi:uncharacterized protein LTR77_007805 [Saxophila tyrrhenica]|uniref:Mob1/phocein n=1 Tax=Saxophila tyrrhenica TaxID=1690608 RepID=A0AAV9P6Y4_9PEZI|nr:hypothetical protein LTR77_007805 [Saxophila tyrrhenica]
MAAPSPGSSPRLPSPPPIAEDQIGPTSPGVTPYEDHNKLPSDSLNNAASRRIRPGTKAEDMAEGPPLVELQDIDSAFQLTEHLKSLYYTHTHPPSTNTITPLTATLARQLSHPPPYTSREIWLYELGRFLVQKTNAIIVSLFQDDPPCSATTCSEMRASEWQYLCAVHEPPKSCAAIDYCCHTLDWAANTLTSSKMFPSRLGLGSGNGAGIGSDKVLAAQMKEIKNIFRRVYRIYAHAWFQHREMFWRVEGRTGLYVFFKTVCDEYGIIEAENYTIPAEAEGLEPAAGDGKEDVQAPSVLRRDQDGSIAASGSPRKSTSEESFGSGETTKRHRHTKSDFSRDPGAVIKEEAEEDETEGAGPRGEAPGEDGAAVRAPTPEKPSLDRQMTALKDMVDEVEGDGEAEMDTPIDPHRQVEPAMQEPQVSILRQETIKPEQQEEKAAEDVEMKQQTETEAEPEGEQTIIEAAQGDGPSEDTGEVKVTSTEVTETANAETKPQEQTAAEAEDADKTVGD